MRIDEEFEARPTSRKRTTASSRSRSASAGRSTASSRSGSSSGRTARSTSASGTRRTTATRSGSGRSGRSGRYNKKRRSSFDITSLLIVIAGILIAIIIASIAFKGISSLKDKETTAEETSVEETSLAEDALDNALTVEGVDITGLNQEEAREKILQSFNWSMKATYGDKEAAIENILYAPVDELLDIIYAGDHEEGKDYNINLDSIPVAAAAQAADIASQWNMTSKSGGLTGYDAITDKFIYSQGQDGIAIDQDKLANDIVSAVKNKKYDAIIEATTKQVSSDLSASEIESKYTSLAMFTTTTTSNSNRNTNIRLAVKALHGTIINPGQEFSFNNTTGIRSEEKGYKAAPAYLNGEVVQEPGGGVCQVSSTLYNAVILAGLQATERHAHTFEPSYVTPGEDAAVSFGGPDFRFVNTSPYPIAIRASFDENTRSLAVRIVGIPVLEDGVKVKMESKKEREIDPPAPTIEEDGTIEPGVDVVAKEGTPGTSWATYLVKYDKNGSEISREFFHNSAYKGKPGIIKRNTSGTLAPSESVSGEAVVETDANGQTIAAPVLSPGASADETKPVSNDAPGQVPSNLGPNPDTPSAPVYVAPGETLPPPTTAAEEKATAAPGPVAPGSNAPGQAPGEGPGEVAMIGSDQAPGN